MPSTFIKRGLVVAFLFFPLIAQAVIDSPNAVINAVNLLGRWMFGVLLALAIVFIIAAAYAFLGSEGDAEKVRKAKNQITYAVIAIGVAALSKATVTLVQTFLGLT